jgi:hypothetical protein
METKKPEIVVILREWEPGQAIQVMLVRPSEVVRTPAGGVDLSKTPSTSYLLLPGGFAGFGVNQGG